jgi:hypothetical protein
LEINIDQYLINGGDDEPQPTWRDVLKAVSTIRKYIDELDDPLAVSHKIEELLGPFNWQLRFEETKNTKHTILTNYFFKMIVTVSMSNT